MKTANLLVLIPGRLLLMLQLCIAKAGRVYSLAEQRASKDVKTFRFLLGPDDIAGVLCNMQAALGENSATCNLGNNQFSPDCRYDFRISSKHKSLLRLKRFLAGPWILGRLSAKVGVFVYVGRGGYFADIGFRRTEARFLKSVGVRLFQIVTGSDFRSPSLSKSLQSELGCFNFFEVLYKPLSSEKIQRVEKDSVKAAAVVTEFFDTVFDFPSDNSNWIDVERQIPFIYAPDPKIQAPNWEKFDDKVMRVLHAPSRSEIKGTGIIRDAMRRIVQTGAPIEYIELENATHSQVLTELSRSHVLVNQLYGWAPGVLSCEGMQAGCAVVTRSNSILEPFLPPGSEGAWVSAGPSQIEDALSSLLFDVVRIRNIAQSGHSWFWQNYNQEAIERVLKEEFDRGVR